MYETFLELKNDFEKLQDSIDIQIEGGGSRTGLMAIKTGEAEIGLSSFEFNLNKELGQNHHISEQVVAYDAIVIITNKNNPIDSLSDEQISKIYNGEILDWKQLGGKSGKILPIIRDENSGTQKFFAEHFQVKDLALSAIAERTNSEIVSKVTADVNSIGFIGFGYFTESVHNLKLPSTTNDGNFEVPSLRTLENGRYPLKRSLRIYYKETTPEIQGFLAYLQTDRAISVIEGSGLIPTH